jgi:hypothetical protein
MRATEYRIKATTECLALVKAGPALDLLGGAALAVCVDCGDFTPVGVLLDTWFFTEATLVAANTAVFPALEARRVAVISGAFTLSVAILVLVVVAVTPSAAVLFMFVAMLVLVGVAVTPGAAVFVLFVAVLVGSVVT